jgi:hypothetical protein
MSGENMGGHPRAWAIVQPSSLFPTSRKVVLNPIANGPSARSRAELVRVMVREAPGAFMHSSERLTFLRQIVLIGSNIEVRAGGHRK